MYIYHVGNWVSRDMIHVGLAVIVWGAIGIDCTTKSMSSFVKNYACSMFTARRLRLDYFLA